MVAKKNSVTADEMHIEVVARRVFDSVINSTSIRLEEVRKTLGLKIHNKKILEFLSKACF